MQFANSKQNKVFTKVQINYSDFTNGFLITKAFVLLEQNKFNKHIIDLKNNK